MTARAISFIVGLFYLLSGGWAFLLPSSFYATVATFPPYNLHLLHDAGAFQVGLGVALVGAAVAGRWLAPVVMGALAGSLLHLLAHLIDINLGGHPTTDLPSLALIVGALVVALVLEMGGAVRAHRS
jgi:hypothetical protein